MKQLIPPLGVMLAGLAMVALGLLLSDQGGIFALVGLAAFVIGSAWTIHRIGKLSPTLGKAHRWIAIFGVSALGLPPSFISVAYLLTAEDVEWMVAPLVVPPGILIMPIWMIALYRLAFHPSKYATSE
jgi:hypothetical protein